jgi:hypothetical protein
MRRSRVLRYLSDIRKLRANSLISRVDVARAEVAQAVLSAIALT